MCANPRPYNFATRFLYCTLGDMDRILRHQLECISRDSPLAMKQVFTPHSSTTQPSAYCEVIRPCRGIFSLGVLLAAGYLLTVTGVALPRLPAASHPLAEITCDPLAAFRVFQVNDHGALLRDVTATPSM